MSDLSAIGMAGALFISGTFLIYYLTAKINQRGHEIVTGVVAGVPISVSYREFLLWITWFPQWAGAVAASLVMVAIQVAIAGQVGGSEASSLAYMCAVVAGFSAMFWLVFGIRYIVLLVSVVRQAEAD